jgi:hypothetical protein
MWGFKVIANSAETQVCGQYPDWESALAAGRAVIAKVLSSCEVCRNGNHEMRMIAVAVSL